MKIRSAILSFLLLSVSVRAWSGVFLRWSDPTVPPANALGMRDLVIPWNDATLTLLKGAQSRGFRVYVETNLQEAPDVAKKVGKLGAAGIVLNTPESQHADLRAALPRLKSAYPKLQFMVLNEGKLPQMKGSMVIKRDGVLEVSSPTAQPWIDTNLSLIKIERTANDQQTPLYTFSWGQSESGQQERALTATDYSLAVAEAGAFHADLLLDVDEHLQKALNAKDPGAWRLWKEVLNYADFYSRNKTDAGLGAAANVAVVVDDLDPGDEVMNLLARHNIPFQVLRASDLQSKALESFDVIVVLAKSGQESRQRIAEIATRGKTVVLVDAQGSYPWHNAQPVKLNEHASSYSIGNGKVIELSEPVTDPETFAQDIRRLLGNEHSLISLWNGLTTIAVPYAENGGDIQEIDFINYAADPLRVQVRVKGSFHSVRYESPEHSCCESLDRVEHNGFTEFVIPELEIAGRVHLVAEQAHSGR
jgi:protein-tyrosine-phosphatase